VSSVTRVFVLQKIRSIAVLKCLGATSGQIIAVYMLQVMSLGLAGSVLGVVIARAAIAAIPLAIGPSSTSLLATVHYTVNWRIALQGVAIGVLISLLFSIVPLLEVRLVKPSLLLRDETKGPPRDPSRIAAMVFVSAALVAVAAWQAASLRVGLVVCVGFAVLAGVLIFAGRLLVKLIAPLANAPSFPLRHAVLHLSRPGNQTRVILLAVGLGAFFIVGVRSLQASLLDEFSLQIGTDSADMFLLDVQRGQVDGMRTFLNDPANGAGTSRLIPVLRARITGVSGRVTTLESFEDVRARGSLAREYTVTYRDHLEANERVIEGSFWRGPSPEPEISIEKGLHERFAIGIGDVVRFDILGRTVNAKVTSIRDVDFKDARAGGFVFVFRPGTLEDAPQTFIAPLKGPNGPAARAKFQHDLVGRFPNVSVIDFHEILETIRDVMSKVTLAITVVGGLVLFSGVLILVGAVAMTKFQRVYEAVRRVRSPGFAGGSGGIGRRRRAHLGREPLRARHSVESVSRGTPRGGRLDGGARCGDWRSGEPRRVAAQAARDASSRVAGHHAKICCSRGPVGRAGVSSADGLADLQGRASEEAHRNPRNRRHQAASGVDGEQHPPGRHGRPGDREQRSSHSAETQANGRQDPAGDRRSTLAHR
jgi:putative ABC transport system permease protein